MLQGQPVYQQSATECAATPPVQLALVAELSENVALRLSIESGPRICNSLTVRPAQKQAKTGSISELDKALYE